MAAEIRRPIHSLFAHIRKHARVFVGSMGPIAALLLVVGMVFCAPASAQSTTTISGNVYAPNGVDPLVNVLVYVTTTSVSTPVSGANCPGSSCLTASNAIPDGVTLFAFSAVNGSFTLNNIPVSTSYILVIQAGKWQRQFLNVSVGTTALTGLQLAMPTIHGTINTGSITSSLPAAQTSGSMTTVNTIPLIAISTGSQDAMECVLRDVGIADTEFTDDTAATATTGGRIHLYKGDKSAGAYITTSTPNETLLMSGSSTTPLNDYDMAMFPCQGSTTNEPAADIQSLIAYSSAGGRIFATHFSLDWLDTATAIPSNASFGANDTFSGAVNWTSGNGSDLTNGEATINTSFTDGSTLAQWMLGVGASTTSGQVALSTLRSNITSVIAPTQIWSTLNSGDNIMQITFNTPVGADAAGQFGRVLYNEYHVENGSASVAFPAECGTSPFSVADPAALAPSAMSAQEKMLEYSLFDLSTFVTAVVPPTATITITTDPANGSFKEGDTGDTITAAVMNTSSTVPLPANTTFTMTLPGGVMATAMTDPTGGWSCTVSTLTCTRSTTLAASTSDSVIVTVSVSSTATGGEMSITGMVTAQVASPNFSSNVSLPITITLVQAAAVSWATPAAITYGTALSGTQLDAVGNAPSGTYAYTPLAAVVLSAGSQTLSVVYTPGSAFTSTYPGTGTASVTLVVNPAAATVTLSGLTQSYTGSPAAVSATTIPASLPVTYTYTGINPTIYGPSSTAPAAAGSYTVVATIASGQNYAGTASGTLVITGSATPDATSTTVQISRSPVMAGQPVTITATIADTTNPGTIPTGSVIFTDTTTNTVLNGGGAVTLNGSGAAVLTGVILDGTGAHTISAAYSGVEGSIASSTNTAQVQVGLSSLVATSLVSYPVTVTITAAGTPANISVVTEGATGLDFTDAVMGDTCISNPPTVGQTCTVNVNFTPKYAGPRYGAVVITDVSGDILGTAYLQGTGTGPEVTFNPGTQSTLPSTAGGVAFNQADGVTVDSSRNVYVADNLNFRIVKIPWTGSGYGTPVAIPLSGQSFNYAEGVAVDGAGNLLVLSFAELVELPWNGSSYGTPVELLGSLNGGGVAVDGAGNVYVSDYAANTVTEVPRTANGYGSASVLFSGLNTPQGVAVDGAGNIYVANQGANTVLEMPWTGSGYGSPITVSSSLFAPGGVAVDAAGDVYIADINNLRAVVVPRTSGGFGTQAVLPITGVDPVGIASDELGNVFVTNSSAVVELDVSDPPSLSFASTTLGATSSDSPRTVTVSNVGNAPMTFTGLSYPGDFPEVSGASGACSTSAQLAAGTGCTLPLNFTPTSTTGPLSESLMLTDNNLNATVAPATQQTIALSGTALAAVAATQEVATTVLTQNHAATSFAPVTGSGGLAPLTYSVSPGLPTGLMFSASTGAITGTPSATSVATSYTVTVTDANNATATASFSLTVDSAVVATQAIASTALTVNHAAVAFTPVTGSGGDAPLSYSVSPGLPTGLMFSAITGAITGTPSVTSTATIYTVTVTDVNGATAQASFSLTVNAAVAAMQTVAATTLTQNHAATPFTPVTGSGGTAPLTYSLSPGLPAGLVLNPSTGAITGTSTVTSAVTIYTVTVTDTNGATATANFSLTVNAAVAATRAVASTVLTQNHAATTFTPVTGSGGTAPLTYSVSPGLPAGLVLNPSTGAITGTPTAANAASIYTVTVTDANGATATASFNLTVDSAVVATQTITSTTLTQNRAAVGFMPVAGSGGDAPLTYSVSPGLPAGLVLNTSTGAITGTPTGTIAASSYTVTVTDANGATATANFNLTVDSAVVATQAVASTVLTANQAAILFTPVTGAGGTAPLAYSVSPGLPAGLVLNAITGAITGTPTSASAALSYTVTVTDTNGATATANFSLTVDSVVLAVQAIRAKELTFYQMTTPFTPVTGSGGTAPLTYSVSPGLPAGLVLNTSTGVISGTPAVVSAAASYTVTVTDTNGETAQASFSLGAAQQASMTVVSANPTTATPVQSVTLSATLASTLAGTPMTPSGTVTFFNGSTQLGVAVPLAGGTAQLVVPSLPPGQTAMITAVYSGDGNFLGGTSGNSASVVVGPLDFTFNNAGTNEYTAAPGAVASYSFTLAPLYSSYAGPVSFTVTGLPAGATASFTPSSVAADGGSVPVQMTVQTPLTLAHNGKSGNGPFGRGIVLALLLLPFGMKRRVREKLKGRMLLLVLLLAGATAAVSGCASNNGFMLQSPQTYTLTVTATSGTLQHSQTVTLIVQ